MRKFNNLLFCFIILIMAGTFGWALDTTIPIPNLTIRQERVSKNGVLISRPMPIDQKIAELMIANRIRTLEEYSTWLEKTMTYDSALRQNHWPDPEQFLNKKHGDCKDFAGLNSAALRVFGFKPHIIALYSSENAHAICAFEYSGKYFWFDNFILKSSQAADLTALAREITGLYHYEQSFELDPVSQKSNLIYDQG